MTTETTLSVPEIHCNHCKMSLERVGARGRRLWSLGADATVAVAYDDEVVDLGAIRAPSSRATQSPTDVRSDTLRFEVDGMTCATCAVRIERVLGRQEGVSRAAVNLAATMAEVDVAPGTDVTRLMQAVEKIGYGIKPAQEEPRDVQEHYGEDERVQWRRFDRRSSRCRSWCWPCSPDDP